MILNSLLSGEVSLANLLILFVTGLVTYITVFYFRYFTRPSPLPGPIPLPIVGNVLQYPGDAGKLLNQLRQIYGDMFEVYIGTTRTICLCRADLVGKLTSSSSTSNFHLRIPPNDGLDDLGVSNKGIFFNRNYDDWSYHRRFLQKTIMSPQVAKETVESTQVLFQEMEGLWKRLGNDKEIDFAKWLPQFTLENIVLLTTTLRIHSLKNYYNTLTLNPNNKVDEPEGTLPNSEAYINSIKMIFESLHFFLLIPKLMRRISGTTKRLLNNKAWLDSNLLGIIKARRAQIESSEKKIDTHDLLTQLLTINTDKDVTRGIADDKHAEKMSDDDVRANMLEILGTGTLTTASTFCYIVYYLAHYPEVQKRMVQELDNVLGNDRDSHITLDQVNKLEYTDAIFKEVSRVFATVPVNIRTNTKPEEIAGHTFPANTQFFIDMEGIHHSSSWSDPDTFNPDRWLTDSSEIKQQKNTFFQFGSGSRICPGKNLALAEIKTLMALLYRKYDVELVDKISQAKYNYRFIKACDELRVKIKPRN